MIHDLGVGKYDVVVSTGPEYSTQRQQSTDAMMELARVIQGSELFVSSMSSPSAIALCLGKTMMLEIRKNEPFERHEYNYPMRMNISYF